MSRADCSRCPTELVAAQIRPQHRGDKKMQGLASAALGRLRNPDLLATPAFGAKGTALPVFDPATGETIASVAACSVHDVDETVDRARVAFKSWRDRRPLERGEILRAWAAGMWANAEDLAVIMTAEQGKPLHEARGEIAYAAGFLDWYAAEGERSYGETIPSHLNGSRLSVHMQPVGVTAAITPWNFPSAMIARKAGAALAAGCTMVVKPAPETPLSAIAVARLAEKAEVPQGVFQIIIGEAAPLAQRLLEHPEICAFSFTGSTGIGRLLLAHRPKP